MTANREPEGYVLSLPISCWRLSSILAVLVMAGLGGVPPGVAGLTPGGEGAGKSADGSLHARGNEPGWTLGIDGTGLVLRTDYGRTRLQAPAPDVERVLDGRRYRVEGAGLVISVQERLCRDDMTGMPYPLGVRVELGDRTLRGCGGAPESLLAGEEWIVEDIAGGGIIDMSRVTLVFDLAGSVSGIASCNSYRGSYQVTGETLRFDSDFITTRKSCAPALMNQERRFLDALGEVTRFDFDRTGALLLQGAGRTLVLARR